MKSSLREQPDRRVKKTKVQIPLNVVGEDMVEKILGHNPTMASWLALQRSDKAFYELLTSPEVIKRIPMIVKVPLKPSDEMKRLIIPMYWSFVETLDLTFTRKKGEYKKKVGRFDFGNKDKVYGQVQMTPLFSKFPNLVHLTVRTSDEGGATAVSEAMLVVDEKKDIDWTKNLQTLTIFSSNSNSIKVYGDKLKYYRINHILPDIAYDDTQINITNHSCPNIMIELSASNGSSLGNDCFIVRYNDVDTKDTVKRLGLMSNKKMSSNYIIRVRGDTGLRNIPTISVTNLMFVACDITNTQKIGIIGCYFHEDGGRGSVSFIGVDTIILYDQDVPQDIIVTKHTNQTIYYTFDNWILRLSESNNLGEIGVKNVVAFKGILSERTIGILESLKINVTINPMPKKKPSSNIIIEETQGELVNDIAIYEKMIAQTDDTFEMMRDIGM